jgi:hypothetical protein
MRQRLREGEDGQDDGDDAEPRVVMHTLELDMADMASFMSPGPEGNDDERAERLKAALKKLLAGIGADNGDGYEILVDGVEEQIVDGSSGEDEEDEEELAVFDDE